MSDPVAVKNVLVTGATGFVGRHVVGELLARGLTPVCLVRSRDKLFAQHPDVNPDRIEAFDGTITDRCALRGAARISQAAIHLVGIIYDRPLIGQTFRRVHVLGTQRVVDAASDAPINRLIHVSALGTRADAVSAYHKTKWAAEQCVVHSDLDWTILRPSLIHGPGGEFMQLMKRFMCGLIPPVIPYFGSGEARVQPVFVQDVAHCVIEALFTSSTVGRTIPLGGPVAYSWKELYEVCRRLIPRARRRKPMVSLAPWLAKVAAALSRVPVGAVEAVYKPIGIMRFNRGQVDMALEENVCDHAIAEQAFKMTMRNFEQELTQYAASIGP